MSKTTLQNGSPVTPGFDEINPETGQQKAYEVLSDEERAKGFARPVRQTYMHNTCGHTTTMARAIAETYAANPAFYGSTFCVNCGGHFPVSEFKWLDGQVVGS